MDPHTIIGFPDQSINLAADRRRRHMAIIGATGSGKTSLLLNMFAQDVARGDGVLYIDPLGDDAERALSLIPKRRANQVCYLNFADRDHPLAMNVLEDVAPDDRELLADNVVSAMRAIWHESWGVRMEQILRHALLALIETPNASLVLLPRLLNDDDFRQRIVARVTNPLTRQFLGVRFERWRDTEREIAIDPVLNKLETFLFSPVVRNVLGQARSTLDFRHEMARRHVVIANLSKASIGDTAAHLMGALLVARVQAAGLARLRNTAQSHPDFHLIIDEAQDIVTDIIPTLLSQARHYGVTLALATQYLAGLSDKTQAALRGNPETLVVFRPGGPDAELLAPEFNRLHQDFNPTALLQLPRGQAAIRIAGDDVRVIALPPAPSGLGHQELMRKQSRRHYGANRSTVEPLINKLLCQTLPGGFGSR